MKFLITYLFLALFTSFSHAQQTVEFRINGVSSNIGDMDGFGSGDSDPQWNYEIEDNTFGLSDNDDYELGGTNCPGIRSHVNTFFSETYDCDLPNSFNFIFRGFEDDGIGSDANSGNRTFTFATSTLNTSGSSTWANVFGGSGWVEVRANGTDCSTTLNSAVQTQGSGSVRYQIRLQYRVLGSSLCNDECNDPYVLPTASQYNCGPTQTSTPLNIPVYAAEPADASTTSHPSDAQIIAECGSGIIQGSSPEDVWVRTTIPDSTGGVIIQFENEGGCTGLFCQTNVSYAWYTSSNGSCSGLEYRGCGAVSCFIGCNDGEIQVDGIAGEDVWVRIWEEDDQGHHIVINSITPTAPADRCYTAMPLSGFGCNYQATSPTSGTYAEPDLPSWTASAHPGGMCQDGDSNPLTNTTWASNENMVWYTYTHSGGDFNLAVDNMSCSGGAATAQIGVFSNSGTPTNPSCDLASETGYGCSVGVGAVQLSITALPVGNYIIVVDGNAGAECEWTFTDFVGNDPLPVELFGFKAELISMDEVKLSWVTGTETNNDYFEIMRSPDGKEWTSIERIDGAGNSNRAIVYETSDYSPFSGISYYLIKQVDFDGTETFSDFQSVNNNLLTDIRLYPNPASTILTVEYGDEPTSIEVFDRIGQPIQTEINHSNSKAKVDVSGLPNGVYFIRVIRDNYVQTEKFTVTK